MKRILLLLVISFASLLVNAQYYSVGEDPHRYHWRQINTPDFQVIYPDTAETQAQHLAFILEKVYKYGGQSLNHKPHQISVILHQGTVSSNGLVIWAPARMELFTTPPQDIYAQEWLDQLAIHEFRHVVQLDKIASELPNIFNLILGQQAPGAVAGLYLPLWFLEGDAVTAETALSYAGRGRQPSFEMELKAQTLEKGIYHYDKAYLGSYKDHVPDYYQMGYQMVAGSRDLYGADLWGKVLHHVARHPLGISSFAKGLKNNTGKNQKALYSTIFNNLNRKWEAEDRSLVKTSFEQITKETKNYTDYQYPYYINDTTFFALRSSIEDIPRFVLISRDGQEKVIFTPGFISQESLTVSASKIYWIETKPDPRWANHEFSLLRIYDLKNKRLFEKRYAEKIFAPSLSYDKKYLSCVKVDEKNKISILLLSPANGKIIKEVNTPGNLFFISPCWSGDQNVLYAVVLGTQGKSLVKFNPFTAEIDFLLPYSTNDLNRPVQKGKFLYFNSSESGVDNVYALDLHENRTFKLTSSRFGTQDPQLSEDGKKLLYSDYTAKGFCIAQSSISTEVMTPVDPSLHYENSLARTIALQEGHVIQDSDSSAIQSEKYSRTGHLIHIHSWAPFRIDATNEEIRPGFSVLSQNMLSTAVTQFGYDYSTINKTGNWFLKFDYSGFYPVLGFDMQYGNGKSHYYSIRGRDTSLVGFSYHELDLNGSIKIPLNLTHGKYFRFIQPEVQAGFTRIILAPGVPTSLFHGNFIPFTYRVYGNNYLMLGTRDLQPIIGQEVNLIYRHTPFGNYNYGSIASGEATLYFPGIFKHHGLRFYGGYQQKNGGIQSFSDLIDYPRGYQNILNDHLLTIKTDYVLPLFYPDWSLGKLTYFKRVSLRMFYDHGQASVPFQGTSVLNTFNSVGSELTIDAHFLRFIVPSAFGVRQSYLIENRSNVFEFLFSMNFQGLRTFKQQLNH